jgi:D-alanyl-D-alanine carboxypeptidase (penicillin-binding protein 5/6)
MTCYLSLLICKKYGVELSEMTTRISEKAAETPGTTAELEHGDILCIKDLLFALMLPSGNDASVALAESLGRVIQRHRRK